MSEELETVFSALELKSEVQLLPLDLSNEIETDATADATTHTAHDISVDHEEVSLFIFGNHIH
jgi:hypothetical protein